MIDFSKYNKFREEAIKASQSPVEDFSCDFTTDMQVKFTYP